MKFKKKKTEKAKKSGEEPKEVNGTDQIQSI